MFSCGWLWMYAGAALMFLELVSAGFVLFFFGLSAATVGVLKLCLEDAFPMVWQLVAFSVFSVVYLAFLRRWVKNVFRGDVEVGAFDMNSEYSGRTGRAVARITPSEPGRILVGDAEWSAESAETVEPGERVRIVARRNLTMIVEPVAPASGGK